MDGSATAAERRRWEALARREGLDPRCEPWCWDAQGRLLARPGRAAALARRLAAAAPAAPFTVRLSAAEPWQVAASRWPADRQRLYSRLLDKNAAGTISPRERERLTALGEEARRLTLKKAHAYLLLKWRGGAIPSLQEIEVAG